MEMGEVGLSSCRLIGKRGEELDLGPGEQRPGEQCPGELPTTPRYPQDSNIYQSFHDPGESESYRLTSDLCSSKR